MSGATKLLPIAKMNPWSILIWVALISAGSAQTYSQIDPNALGYKIDRCGPLDIALIIDASGSIGPRRFSKMLTFVSDSLKDGDFRSILRVSAITFSKRTVVEFLLNTHTSKADPRQEILNNIAELVYTKGVTNTSGALRVASETLFRERNGDREAVQNMAVIITDGNSNVDRDPIQDAEKLKADGVYIVGILIGTDKSINEDEMKAIVSDPSELTRLKSYDDLIPFRETILKRMCTPFFSPPNCQEGETKKKKCRKLQCINGNWQDVGFYGCCFKGRFVDWNQETEYECDTYRCTQRGACQDGVCEKFSVNKIKDGCMVGDKCLGDGQLVIEENVCETFKCEAGEYKMIQKDCLSPSGQCMPVGQGYTEHCVVYQCQNNDGMVDFRPVQTGCSYKGSCYDLGASVMEDCNTLVCSYDDVSFGYDFVLQKQGCNDNGQCRAEGDMWVNTDTCMRYRCVYNKKKDRVVIREQTMGCQGDNGCIKKGSEVSAEGCIKYICNKKGDLEILSVGCEFGGVCKAINETWVSTTDKCTNYVCLSDTADDGTPSAYVQKDQDCHDFNGNCIKVGQTVQDNCNTYTCAPTGHLEPTAVKCSYKGRCYDINAKWIDDVACKQLKCKQRASALFPRIVKNKIGCIDETGQCYRENATKQIDNSCLRYKCYEDRIMRLEVCEYKHACYEIGSSWVDKDDCVTVRCLRDPGSGNAIVDTFPYGCFMDNICHDPGYKVTKDCQEYVCRNGLNGFELVKEACTWKGGCKDKDETWFDTQTCTKYGCFADEDGLDVNEITYGCTSDSNQCIKGGTEHREGCNKYECDNGKLKVISMGCEFNDGCLAADKNYFDKENCVYYSCIAKNTTDGSITTQLKERWGCFDYDKCYLPTWKKTEDCTTYRCRGKTRSFSIVNTECEWMGKCIAVNTTWEHPTQCLTYKCVLGESTGLARVSSDLWGCKDEQGNCHPFGKRRQSNKCVTTECQMRPEGPVFFPVEIGCKFRRKCKKLDSSWINRRRCVQQTCQYAPGATAPNVANSPYGCRDMKNRCRPFGYVARDPENVCVSYKCTPFEIFSPIQTGCRWQDKCMPENSAWYDQEGTCTLYKCIRENVGPSSVRMHTLAYPGCRGFDGECLKEGQIIIKGCTKYQCIPNSGGLVIVQEGCSYGGDCKPLNSTWFDSETCTDYSCLYDSEVNDISIMEKTGCKDDDGKCFTKGERKKEGCNKFICNAASNFRPIKMRCEFKGECKEIDSTWKEGCVTYTCKLIAKGPNFVQTNIEEVHGCIGDDGKCYDIGDELVEDCSKFTCTAGGVLVESQFGCKGFNGQCLRPGDMLEVDCVKYVCDGEAKSMVPVEKACVWKNECKPLQSKWFDKESCRGYSCVLDVSDNDVKIIERTVGCSLSGECKRSRTYQMKDCVQYKCTSKGELIPRRIGCEWDGECADLGMSWTRNCTHYKCVITQEGPDYVQTEVQQQRGCFDSHGKCYDVMDEVSFGCNKYRCSMGGNLDLIDSGCMNRYGQCMKPGAVVEEADGSTHKCVCDGSSCLVVVEVKGCRMNGTLYPFGERMRDGCTVYECQKRDNCGKFIPIEWGCYWVDRCYGPGDKWKSDRGCAIFTCKMYQKSNGDVDMVVARDIGCPYENECKEDGEQWRDGCFEKKCKVRTTKDNSKESSIKIVSGGCQEGVGDSMICHAVGSIWEEHHYDGCFKKQCYVDPNKDNKYTTTTVGAACRDAYGTCRPIGSSGFDAYVNGQLREACKCLPKGDDGTKVLYTCGDQANPFQCEGC